MGRPIKKRFFGSLIRPYQNQAVGGRTGVGAEGIISLFVTNTATNSGYSTTTNVTWVASAPQIAGGIPASGTATVLYTGGTGRIQTLNIDQPGTGYQNTGSLSLTFTPSSAGTAVTFVATTSTTSTDAIAIISFLTTGSSAVGGGDIMKQESSQRYLVQNSQGQGICHLATGTLVAGQMHIIGSDAGGATYWITKLTARKAVVVNRSSTSTAYYTTNQSAPWTLGTATGSAAPTATISLNRTA
jgi:hypothetical protein